MSNLDRIRELGGINTEQRSKIKEQERTIKTLVLLIDELRSHFNNTKKHDVYLRATKILNDLEDQNRI